MAKTSTGDYSIYTLDTSKIMQKLQDGSLVADPARALAKFNTWMNALEKQIQSATGEKGFQFNRSLRTVDPQTQIAQQQVIISNEFAKIFEEQLKFFESKLAVKGSLGDYDTPFTDVLRKEGAVKAEYSTSVYGRSAVNKLKQEASSLGGFAEELKATKASEEKGVTRVKGTVFIPESEYQSQGAETFSQLFPETKKASNIEKRKRDIKAKKEAEEQSLAEEERKRKESDALTVKVNKMMEQAKKEEDKEIAKKKKEEERKRKEALKEREKEEKEREKEKRIEHEKNWDKFIKNRDKNGKGENLRKIISKIGLVVSSLMLIADITRRILSSVIARATKSVQERNDAFSLQLSQTQLRDMNLFDVAHGMAEGTSVSSIRGIATSFSNITKLDEEDVYALAQLTGTSTDELVQGAHRNTPPLELRNLILKKAVENAQKGLTEYSQPVPAYDTKGKYIPEGMRTAKAEYSILQFLNKIAPDLGEMFRMIMTEGSDPSSIFYGKFKGENGMYDVDKWLSLLGNKTEQIIPSPEKAVTIRVGEEFNLLKASIDALKDLFTATISPLMQQILQAVLRQTSKLLPPSESLIQSEKNREQNRQHLKRVEEQRNLLKSSLKPSLEEDKYYSDLLKFAPDLETEDLAGFVTGEVTVKDLETKYKINPARKKGFEQALEYFKAFSYYGNIDLGVALTKLEEQSKAMKRLQEEIDKPTDVAELFTTDEATLSLLARGKYTEQASLEKRGYDVFGYKALPEEEKEILMEVAEKAKANERVRKMLYSSSAKRQAKEIAYGRLQKEKERTPTEKEIEDLTPSVLEEVVLENVYKLVSSMTSAQTTSSETKRLKLEYTNLFTQKVNEALNEGTAIDFASKLISSEGAKLRASEAQQFEISTRKEDNRLLVEVVSKDASGRELGRASTNFFTEMGGQVDKITVSNEEMSKANAIK